MTKISSYKFAVGGDHYELETSVAEFLGKGYQPYGSPYTAKVYDALAYYTELHYQAMVVYYDQP